MTKEKIVRILDRDDKYLDEWRLIKRVFMKKLLKDYPVDTWMQAADRCEVSNVEAKAIMLGITLLWDRGKPAKSKVREPEKCPRCGLNSFRLDVHMRGSCGKPA